jgi:hypothetical protein
VFRRRGIPEFRNSAFLLLLVDVSTDTVLARISRSTPQRLPADLRGLWLGGYFDRAGAWGRLWRHQRARRQLPTGAVARTKKSEVPYGQRPA